MKAETLRSIVKQYLAKDNSLKQNELARRSGIAPSTLSRFLSGEYETISAEQEVKILTIVKPEYSDIDVIAGKIKQIIIRKYPTSIAKEAIVRLAENLQKA